MTLVLRRFRVLEEVQRLCAQRPLVMRHWLFSIVREERLQQSGVSSCKMLFDIVPVSSKKCLITHFWRYLSERVFPESSFSIFKLDLFFFTSLVTSVIVKLLRLAYLAGTEWGYKCSEKYALPCATIEKINTYTYGTIH